MVDYGNTCAIICRFVLLLVLLYAIILSCLVVPSCHFISAITGDEDTHGVGLETFENEEGECEPHNSFVIENYNGMEMAAKVGAYVAPTCGSLVVLLMIVECCKVDGVLFGKCIPGILLMGTVVCQSITFALFGSNLFCSNKDIKTCQMGETGYRSVQACLAYSFCTVLYFCSPMPIPFSPPRNKAKEKPQREESEPDKGRDLTKERYEKRRKEKNVSGRGVSGRSSKLNIDDLKDKEGGERHGKDRGGRDRRRNKDTRGRDSDNDHERSIILYEPKKHDKQRGSANSDGGSSQSSPKYDDYVDTDPDGMDWSAYTPKKREAYYDRQRSKKQAKRERKDERKRKDDRKRMEEHEKRDERERLREWERGRGIDADHGDDDSRMVDHRRGSGSSRDNKRNGRDNYREGGGEDSYNDSYRHAGSRYSDDDFTRQDSYYSDNIDYDASEYEIQPYRSRNDRNSHDDSYRGGRDSQDYSRSQYSNKDDYSYSQSGYDSYTQDGSYFGNDPPKDDSYYEQQSPRASTKQSRSSGRKSGSRGSDWRSHNDSYTTSDDSYNQRGRQDID